MLHKVQLAQQPPEAKAQVNADLAMRDLLSQKDGIPDDVKVQFFGEMMNRYLALKKQALPTHQPNPPGRQSLQSGPSNQAIIDLLPKSYRNKGRQLLEYIQQKNPEALKWNERGEIYTSPEDLVQSSNIVDLLKRAVQTVQAKKEAPAGWPLFAEILSEVNAPSSLLPGVSEKSRIPAPDAGTSGLSSTRPSAQARREGTSARRPITRRQKKSEETPARQRATAKRINRRENIAPIMSGLPDDWLNYRQA